MPTQSPAWLAAARLCRRTGFGATGPRVDAVANREWSTYLDVVLGADPDADPGAVTTPMPEFPTVPTYPGKEAPRAEQDAWNALVDGQMMGLVEWWLRRMGSVHEPIHEKLTLLWHNHFATSALKVRYATYMARQNQTLRTMKLGAFGPLALAMLTDAAMLKWLDGTENVAASPNENLSREFMELFALGHGNGYGEADVKAGAKALTGWASDRTGATHLRKDQYDAGEKTVLGVTGTLDAPSFCDAVLAHPNSAPYVASRLWRQLASDDAPSPEALQRLVAAYGSVADLLALTKAILLDPDFPSGRSTTMPVEWLLGLARSVGVSIDSKELAYAADGILTGLGQRPFYPPDVAGWRHARTWVSTGSTAAQVWAASQLAQRGDLSVIEEAAPGDRVDAVGYLIGVGAWSDRSTRALQPLARDPRKLFAAAANTPEYLTS